MCTAATYKTRDFYFGRTLDYEISYGETVTVTPRNFKLMFRSVATMEHHFAFIGMAHITENYPLYYDAVNEKGLCIAGLNFVGNAHYREKEKGKDNIAQWEFIPWIMGQCTTVNEARKQWNEYLTRGMTPEEAEMARTLLNRIAENAMSAVEREERET